jgi:hypothetical protein
MLKLPQKIDYFLSENMIRVLSLPHGLINGVKSTLTKNRLKPHPINNPNQININYLYMIDEHPLMLATINIHDKIYVSTLLGDLHPHYTHATEPLLVAINHLKDTFEGNVVMTSNNSDFLNDVRKTTEFNWEDISYDLAHENTTVYNKTYEFMYPRKPATISSLDDPFEINAARPYSL